MPYATCVTRVGSERFVVTELSEVNGELVAIARFMKDEERTRRLKTESIRKEAYAEPEQFQREIHDDAVELARFILG